MELRPVQENGTRVYDVEWDKPISKVQMTIFSLYAESRLKMITAIIIGHEYKEHSFYMTWV
jgi:hypothetical protein